MLLIGRFFQPKEIQDQLVQQVLLALLVRQDRKEQQGLRVQLVHKDLKVLKDQPDLRVQTEVMEPMAQQDQVGRQDQRVQLDPQDQQVQRGRMAQPDRQALLVQTQP